ncbi:MAG: peptidase M16 [Kangiella sp.]|nr:MAG: peptidase M16 [Kangiella sp.]
MKTNKIILSFSILFILASQFALADFKMPEYKKLTLKNGLTVYLMEQHEVPLVDIRVVTKAGAINDGKQYGLANLTGDALSLGSGKLSKKEIEDLFAFYGAQLGGGVGLESASTSLSIASKDVDKLLPVFRDIITKPLFNETEFNKQKKRYIDQLTQSRERPRNVIGSAFNKMYYGDHPYGNPVEGDASTVEAITLEQVKSFYKNFYSSNNSALIIVGDFKTRKMVKKIKRLFKGWNSNKIKTIDLTQFNPPKESNVWLINKEDAIETTFMIGGTGIPSNHPDKVALQVINTILGARFTSWLNDELRVNSGLTYGARSRLNSQSKFGNFVISTFTKKETTFEALDLAIKTYHRLWNKGIDKETLDSAKTYVKGQFPPRYETSGQLARLLSTMWSLDLDNSFINNFQKNVDSLDVNKANKIAQSVFPKNNLQYVLVGKTSELKEEAKTYGKIKEMEIKTFKF